MKPGHWVAIIVAAIAAIGTISAAIIQGLFSPPQVIINNQNNSLPSTITTTTSSIQPSLTFQLTTAPNIRPAGQSQPTVASATVGNVSCYKWNPAVDFRVYPNQENPNRDSCGNKDVWHFMASIDRNRNPKTYFLLHSFTESHLGTVGWLRWFESDANSKWLGVYFYDAESTSQWLRGHIYVHPESGQMAVIGWRSPINGTISIEGNVSDREATCGDGVNWYVGHGSKELAAGSISNGGAQELVNGLGSENLSRLSVKKDDFIYIVIDSKGDNRCDTTLIDLAISQE